MFLSPPKRLFCRNPITIPFLVFVRSESLKSALNRILQYHTPSHKTQNSYFFLFSIFFLSFLTHSDFYFFFFFKIFFFQEMSVCTIYLGVAFTLHLPYIIFVSPLITLHPPMYTTFAPWKIHFSNVRWLKIAIFGELFSDNEKPEKH